MDYEKELSRVRTNRTISKCPFFSRFWKVFIRPDIINLLVKYTNIVIATKKESYAEPCRVKDTDIVDMKTLIRTTSVKFFYRFSLVFYIYFNLLLFSVVKWLKRRTRDQSGLGSKPTRAILFSP